MKKNNKNFIIVLAWPEGIIFGTGSWYDFLFSKKRKYRAGHSALVLVKKNKCVFFDFGRYHTPLGKGRVRDVDTDPELEIYTKPKIKNNQIENIKKILQEIKLNKSTHGEGKLYASILSNINFEKAYKFAKKKQNEGAINYGPFILAGTNCSRFVAKTIRNAKPNLITKLRLKFQFCITPSPKRNVSISNNIYYVVDDLEVKKIKKTRIKSYFSSIEKCQ